MTLPTTKGKPPTPHPLIAELHEKRPDCIPAIRAELLRRRAERQMREQKEAA